jgi:hypothetical protein
VDVDFVSYSCYDSLQRGIRDDLHAALDHLESKLKPKPGIPGKRVFIGEYGFPVTTLPARGDQPQKHRDHDRRPRMGLPLRALLGTLRQRRPLPEKPGGFWLINEKNEKQPIWHTHQLYFEWAKKHLTDTKERTGQYPADAEFRAAALEYLRR